MDWPKEILRQQGLCYFTPLSLLRKIQKDNDFKPLTTNPPFKLHKPC